MSSRPVIIGYDDTPASEQALRAAVPLLAPHSVLVVVVWEAGKALDLATLPIRGFEMPPTVVDLRGGFELDQAVYEAAERVAQHGAALAKAAGLDAESRVVANEATVADTLTRLAGEVDSPAVVIGAHGLRPVGETLLRVTARDLVERAPCPVVVVPEQKRKHDE
jgi:nucleotide-binding universal stress UspA family protein